MTKLISSLTTFLPFIVVLAQLTRLPVFGSTINIYLADLMIFLLVAIWIFKKPNFKKLYKQPLFKSMIWFAVVSLISLLMSLSFLKPSQVLISSLYWLRWLIYAGWHWTLLAFFKTKPKIKKFWPKLLIGSAVFLAVLGLIQYFFLPRLSLFMPLGWDEHYYRLASTFFDPNFTGLYLVLGILLSLSNNWLWPFLILYLGLALTYSRSSYLAFLTGLGWFLNKKKQFRGFVIAGVLILLTLLVLPQPFGEGAQLARMASSISRLDSWQKSIQLAIKKPVFGYGFNSLRFIQSKPVSHAGAGVDASPLFVLATTGLTGLTAYLYLLLNIWKKGGVLIKASLLAILAHSFFNNSLFYPAIMFWLWSLLALDD